MDRALRDAVRRRADHRCEYCRLREVHDPRARRYRFHVEHVIARQHGGSDDDANLALACHYCNLRKGPNLSGLDPDGDGETLVPLFHPRRDVWSNHFRHDGAHILGLSPTGRATVWVLQMNGSRRVELREALLRSGQLD